ncbi:conjugal transfer protein TraO [Allomuricauda sp. ARW1Y1]|jgi:outer membrane protein W|uniref:conjugal transfer protein TraO n=1 Tax=Allomuricauda sp. ARW1Y1 TaxID=2663843 RepID=UPI0015CC3D52|nr:conjugal transfer protein TraO [Muricauda sp. ARW1Y1]NYJ28194.1 outer membrane protein W [Muricauda sp. ARW1Y1]
MKKLINILVILACLTGYSQEGNYASSIGVSSGYAEDGFGIMATYNYHLNRSRYAQLSVFAAVAEDKGSFAIPYNIFTVQPGYFFKVLEQRTFKSYALNIGGGAIIGYEVINNGNSLLETGAIIDADSKFIYGAYVGIEGELTLSNDFSLLVKANEYYHVNSDVGNFYPYAGIGLRYFLF